MGANANDSIPLLGRNHTQLLELRPFDHIAFDDGSRLSCVDLIERDIEITGSAPAESLEGASANDRISGGADNVIYLFNVGDDADTIIDSQGANTVRFGEGFTRAGMIVSQSIAGTKTALNLDFGNGDWASILRGEFDTVQTFRFADGAKLSVRMGGDMHIESTPSWISLGTSLQLSRHVSWCWRYAVESDRTMNDSNWRIAA